VRHIVGGALILVCALVLGLSHPSGTAAQEAVSAIKTELRTATFHARELAQKADAMTGVQLHLQHTINCLEGPAGMHFKAAAGYPCQGQGNGIVPDLRAAAAAGVPGANAAPKHAMTAWNLALQAQSMKDVNEAQPWVKVEARYLQMASDALGH